MPKRRYKVTARSKTLGHSTGEEFEADLDPGQEARLIERGAIKVVERPIEKPKDVPYRR